MLVKIIYSWTDRGHHRLTGHHTFAPVDLTASKVAAGKNIKAGSVFFQISLRIIHPTLTPRQQSVDGVWFSHLARSPASFMFIRRFFESVFLGRQPRYSRPKDDEA